MNNNASSNSSSHNNVDTGGGGDGSRGGGDGISRRGVDVGDSTSDTEAADAVNNSGADDDISEAAAAAAAVASLTVSSSSSSSAEEDEDDEQLDPRDNLDDVLEYIKKGRIHAVSLAKNMPHTAQGIQEGRIHPEHFASNLIDVLFERETKQDHPTIVFVAPYSEINVVYSKYFGYFLANYALPPYWFNDTSADGNVGGGNLRKKVCLELSKKYVEICEEYAVVVPREKEFHRACVVCSHMIDREVFNGNKGSFLRRCPLLQHDKKQKYSEIVDQCLDIDEKMISLQSFVENAAEGVKNGMHEPDRSCWECGKFIESKACCCGRCGLAAFCSPECQSKSWKGGHKLKCPTLKSEYDACEKSFSIIEAFYNEKQQQGESYEYPNHHGIELNHRQDCMAAATAHINSFTHPNSGFSAPSVEIFYEYLGRVARKEWWIWPVSDETDSLVTYKANLNGRDDSNYFNQLLTILFFDLSTGSEFYEWIDEAQNDSDIHIPMPAERFLEIYNQGSFLYNEKHQDERSLQYWNLKLVVLKELRDNLHK